LGRIIPPFLWNLIPEDHRDQIHKYLLAIFLKRKMIGYARTGEDPAKSKKEDISMGQQ
jgi:hypothetical protein